MSDNPWMNQPDDIGPYPEEHEMSETKEPTVEPYFAGLVADLGKAAVVLAAHSHVSFAEAYNTMLDASNALDEAERRGAERGWDEGYAAMAEFADWHIGPNADTRNPYRKAAQQ